MKSLLFIFVIMGTVLSAELWDTVKKTRVLNVASRMRIGVVEKNKGRLEGFHYDLIQAFAKENKMVVKFTFKKNIKDYFEGTIFKKNLVIVDNLTVTPARQNKMDFVNLFPVVQSLVSLKRKNPIKGESELAAEKIIVTKGTAYWDTIQAIEKKLGKKFKYHFSKNTGEQLQDLLSKKGTVTILDSNFALMKYTDDRIMKHLDLTDKLYIGWGIPKTEKGLKSALLAFFDSAKGEFGLLQKTWDKYVTSLEDYNYLDSDENLLD